LHLALLPTKKCGTEHCCSVVHTQARLPF
jgi:hypothetical protein